MYIYIVTRIVDVDGKRFGTAVPNLGVHTSLKKAVNHFEGVKTERLKRGYVCHWDIYGEDPPACIDTRKDVRTAMLTVRGEYAETETLKIERWKP